jgi:hypothetical protein
MRISAMSILDVRQLRIGLWDAFKREGIDRLFVRGRCGIKITWSRF